MKLEINTPTYKYYTDNKSNNLVAIEKNEAKKIAKAFKKYKKAEAIPDNETVVGYNFVLDEEYQSLKINFEQEIEFKIAQLQKADIK